MKRINKKLIERKGMAGIYQYTYLCERCDKEFVPENIHTVKYCDECKVIVKREQARERMRRLRKERAKREE